MSYSFSDLTFVQFMEREIGKNWVVAKRSARVVRSHGDDVICLSVAEYRELARSYERQTGWCSHTGPGRPCDQLRDAAPALLNSLQAITKLVRDVQDVMSLYLQPDCPEDDRQTINRVLYMLDGPEQRAIEKPAREAIAKAIAS